MKDHFTFGLAHLATIQLLYSHNERFRYAELKKIIKLAK